MFDEVEDFAMALGLGQEMAQEEIDSERARIRSEIEDQIEEDIQLEEIKRAFDSEPVSLKSRHASKYPENLDKFQSYVDAVIRGEVPLSEIEWNIFNRKG